MARVLITVPTAPDANLKKHAAEAARRISTNQRGHAVTVAWPSKNEFVSNLHHVIVAFLEGGYDWWLTFDRDNPPLYNPDKPDTRNPLELIEYDLDVIGLPTPVLHFGKPGERFWYLNAWDCDAPSGAYREHMPTTWGLERVDAVGTGCVLFSRRVFERPELQTGAFFRTRNPDGTPEKGNDIAFCERARALGIDIYAHYGHMCDHIVDAVSLQELARYTQAFVEAQIIADRTTRK